MMSGALNANTLALLRSGLYVVPTLGFAGQEEIGTPNKATEGFQKGKMKIKSLWE